MAYTNIDDPSAYFQATTYTGNGDSSDDTNAITNGGNSDLKPDLTWFKRMDYDNQHLLFDSTRGVTKYITTDRVDAEGTIADRLVSFDTDGFTVKSSSGAINQHDEPFICWQWKANGGTTTAFSESGSNPGGTRQTNTDAGFSIISYTGTGSNGTIAHGLPSTPEFIIFKRRDNGNFWCVWHQAIGDDNKLALHLSDGLDADGAFMNSTLPTSTNITVGGASVNTNADNGTYICYAFSPIQGYSKFGKYVGNGSQDGPFVYTGFKPAFVIMKRSSGAGAWHLFDNKRSGYNYANDVLQADATAAELSGQTYQFVDFLSNGFKNRRATHGPNVSGETYIYMAWAENPFVTSTGVPTTAI
jgi:hypothetical protein